MKILVVDDSRAMRILVTRGLRQAGYGEHQVVEAEGAEGALALIRAGDVDLVLSDWNMPGMSGLQLLETVRQEGRGLTFGFITSEGSAEMRARATEAGASFLLAKPFSPEQMREQLGAALSGREAPPASATRSAPDGSAPDGLSSDAARLTLRELLGRQVALAPGPAVALSRGPAVFATYLNSDGELGAVTLADLPCAAHLGAALALLPPGVATESLRSGTLISPLQDNFYEVCNVLASTYIAGGGRHVRLDALYAPPERAPSLVQAKTRKVSARLDLAVNIERYGTGALSLLLL